MTTQMFPKINGRYRTRNGSFVVVHNNIGHLVDENKVAKMSLAFTYGVSGNCVYDSGLDLMSAIENGCRQRSVITGCKECEKENG